MAGSRAEDRARTRATTRLGHAVHGPLSLARASSSWLGVSPVDRGLCEGAGVGTVSLERFIRTLKEECLYELHDWRQSFYAGQTARCGQFMECYNQGSGSLEPPCDT